MSCEEIQAQLPDYTLGTLSETEAAAVRRHLRACTGCRLEARTLDEGVAMFAGAAHGFFCAGCAARPVARIGVRAAISRRSGSNRVRYFM